MIALFVFTLFSPAASAQTVTAPSGAVNVPTAGDFFSSALQDAADMNNRTDVGWFAYGVDLPRSNISGISFSGGVFSGTAANGDPNIYLLETGNPLAVRGGRRGDVYPIDGSHYRTLAIRMRLSGAQGARASDGQILWTTKTIYDSPTSVAGSFAVYGGWQIYLLDIPAMGLAAGQPWQGSIGSLRIDPTVVAGQSIDIDWARLVSNDAASMRTITWSGGGAVDIYLDTDTSEANGTLGLIAKNGTTLSRGVTGGSFSFQPGALPAGNYYVAMRPTGTSQSLRYSSGYYQVEGVPTLQFTSPSPEGSSDDFATTHLGNAWDMNSTSDVPVIHNISSGRITTVSAETPQGTSLGQPRVYMGTGTAGDPMMYLHTPQRGGPIDSSRYRIATIDYGLPGDRHINGGSVARIVWRVRGEGVENVSEDIIVNHRSGANVMDRVSVDMKTLPVEPGAGSPSHSGWVGQIDQFRFDPHEFGSLDFWVARVKLAALERAGSSYRIAWNYQAKSSSATMSLWYDSDGSGFNGTRIIDGIAPAGGGYTWNTAGLVPGQEYFIYARLTDSTGRVVSQTYAPWPIVGGGSSSPAPTPAPTPAASRPMMSLDTPGANATVAQPFGLSGWALDAGAASGTGVDVIDVWAYPNPGSGAPAIYAGRAAYGGARPDLVPYVGGQFANVGYGLTVKGLAPGVYQLVAFARSTVTGTFAIARGVVLNITTMPLMWLDTPGNGQTVGSAFLVAGWATDLAAASGTGVGAVHIWAYPNPGSGAPPRFLGSATLNGTRPDVAAAFGPTALRSGFGLNVGLSPGVYDIAVFMQSTVAGTFNNVRVARVTVR